MSDHLFCSFCDQQFPRTDLYQHAEDHHVGCRSLQGLYDISCGSCIYRVSVNDENRMIEHCYKTQHQALNLTLDWASFFHKETKRVIDAIHTGVKLLAAQDIFTRPTANISPLDPELIELDAEQPILNVEPSEIEIDNSERLPTPVLHPSSEIPNESPQRTSIPENINERPGYHVNKKAASSAEQKKETGKLKSKMEPLKIEDPKEPKVKRKRYVSKEPPLGGYPSQKLLKVRSSKPRRNRNTSMPDSKSVLDKLKKIKIPKTPKSSPMEAATYETRVSKTKHLETPKTSQLTSNRGETRLKPAQREDRQSNSRQSSSLKKRMKNAECKLCSRTGLSCANSMVYHVVSHTELKLFKCKTCNYKFSRLFSVQRHNKISCPPASGDPESNYTNCQTPEDIAFLRKKLSEAYPEFKWRLIIPLGSVMSNIQF